MPLLAMWVLIFQRVLMAADDHANQGRYDDAAHIAWQVYAIHRQQAGHVAQYGHSVRDKTLFAVSQFVECPAVDFLKQIDAQHR